LNRLQKLWEEYQDKLRPELKVVYDLVQQKNYDEAKEKLSDLPSPPGDDSGSFDDRVYEAEQAIGVQEGTDGLEELDTPENVYLVEQLKRLSMWSTYTWKQHCGPKALLESFKAFVEEHIEGAEGVILMYQVLGNDLPIQRSTPKVAHGGKEHYFECGGQHLVVLPLDAT